MKSNESCENYLKAIYELQKLKEDVRSVDIAGMLGYSKASVCEAVRKLKQKKLIELDANKEIHLTALGEKTALDLEKKYMLVKSFLILMNVDEQTAAKDACLIEHVISSESIKRIEIELIRNLKSDEVFADKNCSYN